jgi:PEP-CTERM motif
VLAVVTTRPSAAYADTINFVLNNPVQVGAPGATLTFTATVSAPSTNSGSVFLNSDTFTIPNSSPFKFSNIDDSFFFSIFPASLDPNGSFTGTLFTLSLPAVIAPGAYGNNFILLDFVDQAGLETFASQEFIVNVPGQSPVPEPGTWVLLATGIGVMAFVYSRRNLASNMAA